tara:strand:- start:100 stop:312 length:213 start_codon:yes stop_codon:yes gene_type:complete
MPNNKRVAAKDYDAIEVSKQAYIKEDADLIETNRCLVVEIKRLKSKREENLVRRRFIAKQIKSHDYELYN